MAVLMTTLLVSVQPAGLGMREHWSVLSEGALCRILRGSECAGALAAEQPIWVERCSLTGQAHKTGKHA